MGLFKKKIDVKKQESNIANIRNLDSTLRNDMNNQEIIVLLNSYLSINTSKPIDELYNKWLIDFTSSNELSIKSPNGIDYFHILVTPSRSNFNTLGIDYSEKDGNHVVQILIRINEEDNKILYTKREVERQIQGRNDDAQAMSNKTIIKNFIDGELRYHYEYCVESCFRLDQNFSNAYLSEVFVDMDCNAVKRIARIAENDWNKDNATATYYESDNYREKPFNDIYDVGHVTTKMELSDKSKFDKFISNSNNILSLKK